VQKITATHNHVTAFAAETHPKQKFCLLVTHAKTTITETKTNKKHLEKNKKTTNKQNCKNTAIHL